MTDHMTVFTDKFAHFATGIGLPPSAARILAYLLICEPRQQTAVALQKTLRFSTGSVSLATMMLKEMGLIETVRLPNDRKYYYQVVPGGFTALVQKRLLTFGTAAEIAALGLQHRPGDARLQELKELYSFLDKEMKHLIVKLPKGKA